MTSAMESATIMGFIMGYLLRETTRCWCTRCGHSPSLTRPQSVVYLCLPFAPRLAPCLDGRTCSPQDFVPRHQRQRVTLLLRLEKGVSYTSVSHSCSQ